MLASNRFYVYIFVIGIGWASCSDLLISGFENEVSRFVLESVRIANNFVLFGVVAVLLYRHIRKQQFMLRASEVQYRSLFESNPNPMWVFNKETLRFIAVNNAAIQKYGFSRAEFLKRGIFDIRPAEDHGLLTEALKVNRPGISESGIWRHIKKSGEIFWVAIVSHDVAFDRQSGKMVMVTDMTTIIEHEQMLSEAYEKEKQLNNTLAELAWSNSHEVRKPVSSILGLVELLKYQHTEEEIRESLALLETCAGELDQIIRENSQKISALGFGPAGVT